MSGQTPNVDVNFRATGLDGVRRGLKMVRDDAEPTGRQWASATRTMASGLENVARQGKITGESLKMVLTQGADIAFAFGATGAIVGAIAITGAAIYEHITGNMKEARLEAEKTKQAINAMIDAGDKAGIYKQMSTVWRGTPSQGFTDGLTGLMAQRDDIRRQRDEWTARDGLKKWRELAAQLDAVNAKIAKQQALFDQLRAAYNAPMPVALTGTIGGMTTTASAGGTGPLMPTDRAGGVSVPGVPGISTPMRSRAPSGSVGVVGIGANIPGLSDAEKALQARVEAFSHTFADILADSISAGIQEAVQSGNIGKGFEALGKAAVAGLGSVAVQIGKHALAQMAFIKSIGAAIATMNPVLGAAAAVALIALGSAAMAAGGRGGGYGGSGGGYGGGYGSSAGYGAATVIDRGIIDPTRGAGVSARSNNQYNVTIIGTNDPKVKREFQELMRNADGRGSIG